MATMMSRPGKNPDILRLVQKLYARIWRGDKDRFSGVGGRPTAGEVEQMVQAALATGVALAGATRYRSSVEQVVAEALLNGLGATRVTKYKVRNDHIKILCRWELAEGKAKKIKRRELADSRFFEPVSLEAI